MDSTLSNKLEELINENIDKEAIPYVKGNSIRIKNIVVRKSKAGWLIYDTETNTQLERMFCKSSALAYANVVAKKLNTLNEVLKLDKLIQKHYNDCVFYLHTLRITKDATRKEVARTRYDISYLETRRAAKDLEHFIFK
jgi:hypothetical protein